MPTGDGLLARVHPPLGILTPAQARAVAEGARRFGNGHVDVTMRANLQIRGVRAATQEPLAGFLEAAGLGDLRADGGPQRLTLTGPLAGLDPSETIDVPALARAIEAAGRAIPGLPAKTLVAVEGGSGVLPADADVCVRALGLDRVALAAAGDDGPRGVATCRAAEAPAAVAALLASFARTGRRRVRDLSADERLALASTGRAVPAQGPPPSAGEGGPCVSRGRERGAPVPDVAIGAIHPPPSLPSPPGSRRGPSPTQVGLARLGRADDGSRAGPRSVGGGTTRGDVSLPAIPPPGITPLPPGRVVLAVEAPFGRCTADALDRLAAAAEDLGADEIRLSPARGFVLIVDDGAGARDRLADLAADFVSAPGDPRRAVAACTGAPACASGTTPTLRDAGRLADAFRPLAARGLAAHVSGCDKGCARPGPADLTLVGRDGLYDVVLGGGASDPTVARLPIEAALERLGRASTLGLAAAFAPEIAAAGRGRERRPA